MHPPLDEQRPGDPVDLRVYFAAERTLLAWIRTGLAMMGFGFVVARFGLFLRELAAVQGVEPAHRGSGSLWIGTTLILLGVAVHLVAAVQHVVYVRGLARGRIPRLPRGALAVLLSCLLAIVGLAAAVYLIAER